MLPALEVVISIRCYRDGRRTTNRFAEREIGARRRVCSRRPSPYAVGLFVPLSLAWSPLWKSEPTVRGFIDRTAFRELFLPIVIMLSPLLLPLLSQARWCDVCNYRLSWVGQ